MPWEDQKCKIRGVKAPYKWFPTNLVISRIPFFIPRHVGPSRKENMPVPIPKPPVPTRKRCSWYIALNAIHQKEKAKTVSLYADWALFVLLVTRVGIWLVSAFSSSLLHTEFTALLKNPVKRELLLSMRSALNIAASRHRAAKRRQVALHICTVR